MPQIRRDEWRTYGGAGDFRHPCWIVCPSSGVGSIGTRGELTPSSTAKWKAHVQVESLAGDEAAYARTLYPTATYRVTARYDSRINERCRINVMGTTLHVLGVVNVNGENRELMMTCGQEK